MIQRTLTLILLIFTVGVYAQTDQVDSFESKGLRLVSEIELTKENSNKILNFNFKEYRKANTSVFVKIVDGPHIELFSTERLATGKKDVVHVEEEHSDLGTHVHIPASERKIKTFEIISLNVFEITIDKAN
jgi:uncharacterized transporter YbjL